MSASPSFYNLTSTQEQAIARASIGFQGLERALNTSFQQRKWLIRQLMYALMSRNNVLIFGLHGTAKSLLAKRLFKSIVGQNKAGEVARIFNIQMDADTSKSDVIGPLDILKLQKEGLQQRNVKLHLANAHFANFDEGLDALSIVRGLNDVLEEHWLIEGALDIPVPLLTAVISTNRSPAGIVEMYPTLNLGAFTDRFMFVSNVRYLTDPDSVTAMVLGYLMPAVIPATIQFQDLLDVIEILTTTNQYPSREYALVYSELLYKYRLQLAKDMPGTIVSDRRITKLTQLPEAAAVFDGRANLVPEDLLAVAYGLCPGDDSDEFKIFTEVARPIIGDATKVFADKTDAAVKNTLYRIDADVKAIEANLAKLKNPSSVGAALQTIGDLRQELNVLNPTLGSTRTGKENLLKNLDELKNSLTSGY